MTRRFRASCGPGGRFSRLPASTVYLFDAAQVRRLDVFKPARELHETRRVSLRRSHWNAVRNVCHICHTR